MAKHTPEPWSVHQYNGTNINANGDLIMAVRFMGGTDDEGEANAARATVCVNACAGIDDPAATLEEVRDVLRVMIHGGELGWDASTPAYQARMADAWRNYAIRLLPKLGKG